MSGGRDHRTQADWCHFCKCYVHPHSNSKRMHEGSAKHIKNVEIKMKDIKKSSQNEAGSCTRPLSPRPPRRRRRRRRRPRGWVDPPPESQRNLSSRKFGTQSSQSVNPNNPGSSAVSETTGGSAGSAGVESLHHRTALVLGRSAVTHSIDANQGN
jgi:hypothetical protein